MTEFSGDAAISTASWQAFERLVCRVLLARGATHVGVIGTSGDGGADVLAIVNGKRWLVQVKKWAAPVASDVIERTISAAHRYSADVPVIVSKSGFTASAVEQRGRLAAEGINVQLWDRAYLVRAGRSLPKEPPAHRRGIELRDFQERACSGIVQAWRDSTTQSALVVLATGLGKTFVAAESLRRVSEIKESPRVLVLAHTNDLVYQLERSFWPFLRSDQATVVVNGNERPDWGELERFDFIFASRDTLANAVSSRVELPRFDFVVVDECHHLGAETYEKVLDAIEAGTLGGPFLLGLTATPWRPDGSGLDHRFDGAIISIDLVEGLKTGYLANVDYRMFTDNVNWDALRELEGDRFTPKAINRTLFIDNWDEAVVARTAEAWGELASPKGIVFCGTVSHADRIAERINALGFTAAAPIYSRGSDGRVLSPIERNSILWDFTDGKYGILCAVDVLNEGVDIPDVNLVVFQRVTHSRRIFVQQLGRGLRVAPGKDSVVVLDFVSDIRRFAAGLELQRSLEEEGPRPGNEVRIKLPSKVQFFRANSEDHAGANFLAEWLGDLTEVADAGEDINVLRYPPLPSLPARPNG